MSNLRRIQQKYAKAKSNSSSFVEIKASVLHNTSQNIIHWNAKVILLLKFSRYSLTTSYVSI